MVKQTACVVAVLVVLLASLTIPGQTNSNPSVSAASAMAGNQLLVSRRCVLTLELKQVHYTLNMWEHAKDAINAATFDIPVDREFYDSVKVGDVLSDKFRTGSLILRGSFGKWKISVKQKREE